MIAAIVVAFVAGAGLIGWTLAVLHNEVLELNTRVAELETQEYYLDESEEVTSP